MDRQTTLAFVLIGAVLILWLYLNSPKQPVQSGGPDTTLTNPGKTNQTTAGKEQNNIKNEISSRSNAVANVNDSSGFAAAKENNSKYFPLTAAAPQTIIIENDLVILELSSKGGDIKKYFLKNYKNWFSNNEDSDKDFYQSHVQLVDYPDTGGGPDLSFFSSDDKEVNTENLDINSDA